MLAPLGKPTWPLTVPRGQALGPGLRTLLPFWKRGHRSFQSPPGLTRRPSPRTRTGSAQGRRAHRHKGLSASENHPARGRWNTHFLMGWAKRELSAGQGLTAQGPGWLPSPHTIAVKPTSNDTEKVLSTPAAQVTAQRGGRSSLTHGLPAGLTYGGPRRRTGKAGLSAPRACRVQGTARRGPPPRADVEQRVIGGQ